MKTQSVILILFNALSAGLALAQTPPAHLRQSDQAVNQSVTRVSLPLEVAHRNLNLAFMKCGDFYASGSGFIYPSLGKADLVINSINPSGVLPPFTYFDISTAGGETVIRGYNYKPVFGEGKVELIRAIKPMAEQGPDVDCKKLGWPAYELRPQYRDAPGAPQ